MLDRETIGEPGDGGAGAIVAGLLAVALVIVGCFFFYSLNHNTSDPIDISVPKTSVAPASQ